MTWLRKLRWAHCVQLVHTGFLGRLGGSKSNSASLAVTPAIELVDELGNAIVTDAGAYIIVG